MKNSVLIVERDSSIRRMLVETLQGASYHVRTVEDGIEAIREIESEMPHVILSDWAMPGMNGRELCRIIKSRKSLLPTYFILLTSRAHEIDSASVFDAGADDYLLKPCEPREIIARVSAGIRIVELQRDLTETNDRLSNALRVIQRELQVVSEIQKALLPQYLPAFENIQFDSFYRPSSQCGGDYYDILALDANKLGLVMADVSGHGTPAMVAMAITRLLVHTHACECKTPVELLTMLNRRLLECLPTEQYLTMFYGILNLDTMSMSYSSAGHPAPLWYKRDEDRIIELAHCDGFPLKLIDTKVSFENWQVDAKDGDHLLMYTDGATDIMNSDKQMFGVERLSQCFGPCCRENRKETLKEIVRELDAFAGDLPQMDDITMLEFSIRS